MQVAGDSPGRQTRRHRDTGLDGLLIEMRARAVPATLQLTEAWCKGCNICVKMCPERCLVLNSSEVVELADSEACTACRLCEWLCPDFAIAVHVHKQEAVPA